MKRNKDSLRDLWDNIKHTNICIIDVPEGEEREKEAENIYEDIIAENFPNLGKERVTQIQEAQRVPYRMNPKRNTTRYTVIKMNIKINKGKETNNIQRNSHKAIS